MNKLLTAAALAALTSPAFATDFAPQALTLDAPRSLPVSGVSTFTVTGAQPGETVSLFFGTELTENCFPNVCVPIGGELDEVTRRANASGTATFNVRLPAGTPVDSERFAMAGARRPGAPVISNVERVRAGDGGARIRIVHLSPDAPAVDIYANGGLLVSALSYQDSTGYVSVPAGTYAIDIRAAGAPSASTPAFSIPALGLDANIDYTAVATGFLGSSNPADAFRVLPLVDDYGSALPGQIRARILHASPDAPTVSIDVGNDGSNEVPALARFADTGSDGVALPSDTSLQVGIANGLTAFTIPGLPAGVEATVIAAGRLGAARASEDDAFGLYALVDDALVVFLKQNPKVYVFHASPDAPTVDLKAGAATIVNDLSFRELSAPVQVPPAAYTLGIFEETGTTQVTTYTTPSLAAGESYLAIATGFLSATPAFQVLALNEAIGLDAANATFQAIHASPDAPTVTVGIDNGAFVPLASAFSFTDISGDVTAPPATYDLALSVDGTTTALQFSGVALGAGDRFFAVANGSLGAGGFGITVIDVTSPTWAVAATLTPDP